MGATRDGRITAVTGQLDVRGRRLPRLGGRRGGALHVRALRRPERADRRLRRGRQQAASDGLPGAGRAPGRLRGRVGRSTSSAEKLGHGPARVPAEERRRGGHATARRHGARRRSPSPRRSEAAMEHPHYTAPLGGPEPRPRRRLRLVAQLRPAHRRVTHRRQRRRHREPGLGLDRPPGHPDLASRCRRPRSSASTSSDVHPIVADTDSIGYTGATGGSRTTYATGIAAIEAAREAIAQMCERAAHRLGGRRRDGDLRRRRLHDERRSRSKRMTFKELARRLLMNTAGRSSSPASVDARARERASASRSSTSRWTRETGKVKVLRYTALQDVGQGDPPRARRGADPGRRRPGHRLGAVRGLPVRRRRAGCSTTASWTTSCRPRSTCR